MPVRTVIHNFNISDSFLQPSSELLDELQPNQKWMVFHMKPTLQFQNHLHFWISVRSFSKAERSAADHGQFV